jgi:hypothetical protein
MLPQIINSEKSMERNDQNSGVPRTKKNIASDINNPPIPINIKGIRTSAILSIITFILLKIASLFSRYNILIRRSRENGRM